ncbi:MAG: hypothetical protein M3209_17045 [Acidobacteriota bacterium]|nr:hypothetical protein [Acidobacteriota bacterium]
MKKSWLFAFLFVLLMIPSTALGQVTIIDSPFLYKPAESYNDCDNNVCFIDTVVLNQHHRDVPIRIRFPRGTTGRLPFILWSHGGNANENGRELNETWGRTLARAGYIVVHMSHRPWTSAERAARCLEFAAANQDECLNLPMIAVNQARDANVVLGALDTLEQSFPVLSNRIDRNNIAVAGWSGGSLTAMALAGARFRLTNAFNDVSFASALPKVFLALSPQGPDYAGLKTDSWREIFRPVLTATGLSDSTKGEDPPSRLVAFRSMPPGKKYQLYINHPATIHATFNLENTKFPQFSQWLASYTLAYFDANLKNKTAGQAFLISNRLPLYASRKVVTIYRK